MSANSRQPMAATPDLSLDEQMAVLMRGVSFGDTALREAMEGELRQRLAASLETGRPLRVYLGVDPTSSDLHLGHTVPLRKLRQFTDLGHEAVFLIGTFTGLIGDPSDKTAARQQQTAEQARAHASGYVEQAMRVLDSQRTRVEYNDRWLAPLTFAEVIALASEFTVGQFLARDNFRQRFERGEPIWLHEFFYALMQAYDAVALETDVQIGGTEQLFNLMAGRKLMEARGMRPQVCLTMPILVGTDGHARMSKSSGNAIGIAEQPAEQLGKVMSLPDEAMPDYARLVTRWSPTQIEAMLSDLAAGRLHPRDAKERLAKEIVSTFWGDEAAQAAADQFRRVFAQGRAPRDIPVVHLKGRENVVDLIVDAGLAGSKSQARRLIDQGGVRLDGELVTTIDESVEPRGQILQVGKRRFVRLASRSPA